MATVSMGEANPFPGDCHFEFIDQTDPRDEQTDDI